MTPFLVECIFLFLSYRVKMILSFQLQFAFSYSDLSLGLLSVAGANAATNSGENSPHRLP